MISFNRLCKIAGRFVWKRSWKYTSDGYCPSCDGVTLFVYLSKLKSALSELISHWDLSDSFKINLLERENNLCIYCLANFRMRAHADAVLRLLKLQNSKELVKKLKSDNAISIYETAAYSVFRMKSIKNIDNYVVSEYFDNEPFGNFVNGIRNENLEHLTFSDNTFDVIINSDVLEHVADLDKTLSEIKRILKPGGFHVFTIPVDCELAESVERAKVIDGKIVHILEPETHGDTIREGGVLAFRNFGANVLNYIDREGFACKEFKYFKDGRHISSVYYSQKTTQI